MKVKELIEKLKPIAEKHPDFDICINRHDGDILGDIDDVSIDEISDIVDLFLIA